MNQFEMEKNVDVFEVIHEMGTMLKPEDTEVEAFFFDDSFDVTDPMKLDKNKNNLMIFDDLMMEKNQNTCESFYCRRRHNNCYCF